MPLTEIVTRQLARRTFATLSSVSAAGRPHAPGVLYALAADGALWSSTLLSSRKARNVAANPHVAVSVAVRRSPFGPPSTIQFQGRGEVVAPDDPRLRALVAAGGLRAVTGHGELELPGGCFLRVVPTGRIHTYGLGMSLLALMRNPLDAAGVVELPATVLAG